MELPRDTDMLVPFTVWVGLKTQFRIFKIPPSTLRAEMLHEQRVQTCNNLSDVFLKTLWLLQNKELSATQTRPRIEWQGILVSCKGEFHVSPQADRAAS